MIVGAPRGIAGFVSSSINLARAISVVLRYPHLQQPLFDTSGLASPVGTILLPEFDIRLSECPVRATIDVIEGKWKPNVVNTLNPGTLRFGQLRRHVPEATQKVLTEQLRELEKDQIITRKVLGQRWERVEYALTPYGRTLVPVLGLMAKWGKKHKKSGNANNGAEAACSRQSLKCGH
jgi:DNA-binding HxlR family transcriptional regulator